MIKRKKNRAIVKIPKEFLILSWVSLSGFIIIILVASGLGDKFQQFVSLADSFLHGKLFLLGNTTSYYDAAFYQGHYYWPLGPFPALILLPFVFISSALPWQSYLHPLLILATFVTVFLLGLNITKNRISSFWASFGYIFSTAYIGLATNSTSWTFAQVVENLLIFLAILGIFRKWHPFVIGLFLAAAIATRIDMIFTLIFFLIIFWLKEGKIAEKIKNIFYFLVPVFISLISLVFYNFVRFGSFFEQGYSFQKLVYPEFIANRAAGVWSLVHFPANLFYLFLSGPEPILKHGTQILVFPYLQPNLWGMSIFITSPMLLAIFAANYKNRSVLASALTAFAIFLFVMGYYGIGFMQFGYRYALDFYPFLLIIFLFAVQKKFPNWVKMLIFITFFTNLYLLFL